MACLGSNHTQLLQPVCNAIDQRHEQGKSVSNHRKYEKLNLFIQIVAVNEVVHLAGLLSIEVNVQEYAQLRVRTTSSDRYLITRIGADDGK